MKQKEANRESNLSKSQLLLWSGQELNPNSPMYNMALTFEFNGFIDHSRFSDSFQTLVDQCDAMRTVFQVVNGIPQQKVQPKMQYTLDLLDWSNKTNVEIRFHNWVQKRSQQLLNLSSCAFESMLIKLASDRFVWYLNQHHLITDAWSVSVQYRVMAELYQLSLEGNLQSSPALPTFQDYLRYERAVQQKAGKKEVIAYWDERVGQLSAAPSLYGDTGGQVISTHSERVTLDLGIERSNRLRALTQEDDLRAWTQHLSLYNIFATVLFAYLHRVSGQQQFTIGTPAHNRPTVIFKETPGLFIELFPLFAEIESGESFDTVLQQIRTEVNGFLRHALPGASSAKLNRSFNVVLNYIHASFLDFNGISMKSEWIHPNHCDPRHHLRLHVHDFDASGSIHLHFDLNSKIFEQRRHAAVPQHFLALLDAFIEDRSQPVGKPTLLTEPEFQHMVHHLNNTTSDNGEFTVMDLIAMQVSKFADAPALYLQGRSISYQTLEEKSNKLAHYLLLQNIGAGQIVALYLRRSIELFIGIWGVLKTGAAYVPIASNYPEERVAYILADVNASLVLTSEKLEAACKVEFNHLRLDADWDQIESLPVTCPPVKINPDNLAYIMFTSGSTGQPKGVMISHRALVNYVTWAKSTYLKTTRPAFPLFTITAFDLTVTSIFLPLASGGSVVIYPENDSGPDLAILEVISDDLVDALKLTPSHLALLIGKDLTASRVQMLIVGGEEFKSQMANDVLDMFCHKVQIFNEYGPTEATVGCVVHQVEKKDNRISSVPIGTPISNMQAYVLDTQLNPVPQGTPGELYLSGIGLAEGYWNQPELSSEKFIPNPFFPKTQMYRTGDRVRMNKNYKLEYLGRYDHQVKIGGLRTELGEIEEALIKHPDIKQCVVGIPSRKQLEPKEAEVYCTQCGLPSNYPSSEFDSNGVCNLCRSFENYHQKAQKYFLKLEELNAIFNRSKLQKKGVYDCIMLLSGGKDSTYALARLVEMDLKVLAFTLDNGYISDQAKANIKRVVNGLGVDHIYGETPAMNDIFVDSLQRHCNVCNGCFKTIYTLSTELAIEKGIPIIVTGLSRGQFFETRLTEELFRNENVDFDRIDQTILEARKAYHRTDDAVSRLLDVSFFKDDRVFEQVQFVDFYRFCDVSLDEMLAYLDECLPWVRPTDTGRSTNCLINQVGIFIHKKKRGYSNYAFPYSWDVRVGHKTREESIDEINEKTDDQEVDRILNEIGYQQTENPPEMQQLVAYYVSASPVSHLELRQYLAHKLPDYMIPAHFWSIAKMPLTFNGKIDRKSLPGWSEGRPDTETIYRAPESKIEEMLFEIWSEVLQIPQVGVDDNFIHIGGNSLGAIRILARINEAFQLDLLLNKVFEYPTIAEFGEFVEKTIEHLLGEEE